MYDAITLDCIAYMFAGKNSDTLHQKRLQIKLDVLTRTMPAKKKQKNSQAAAAVPLASPALSNLLKSSSG